MNRKMSWGIAALIIILIAASGFIYWQWSQVQQLKEQLAQDEKMLEEKNKPKVQHAASTSDTKPPDEPGFVWVRHGDHWDKVPIELIGQQTPTEPPVQVEQPAKPAYTGPLTYHEELLKTDPVEALRLQTEERGHWSAEWIPIFEPGDQEAEAIAHNLYIRHYYKSIGDTDNPIYKKAGEELMSQTDAIDDHSSAQRRMDLLRLTWTYIPPEFAVTRVSPSNQDLPLK